MNGTTSNGPGRWLAVLTVLAVVVGVAVGFWIYISLT